MTEQVGRNAQWLEDDDADFIKDPHDISMQTVGTDSIARLYAAIRQPYREIVAETGFLVHRKAYGQTADRILAPAGFCKVLLVVANKIARRLLKMDPRKLLLREGVFFDMGAFMRLKLKSEARAPSIDWWFVRPKPRLDG
jgi:hypothetical protein